MRENEVAKEVVDAALAVHRELGPGLLETIYEKALEIQLKSRSLALVTQLPVVARYKGVELGEGHRIDMVVEGCLVLELKSVESLLPVHKKQLLTYLRLAGHRLGLLINFGAVRLADGIHRVANGLPEPS